MARFHVYRLKGTQGDIIDIQADLLNELKMRIVTPLLPASEKRTPIGRLNPQFAIDGQSHIMCAYLIAAIPVAQIGDEIADLTSHQDEIAAAVDFAFQGF